MKMVLGVVRSEMATHSCSNEVEPMFDEGLSMDSPYTVLRLLRSSD